jgi:GNAT superfamily N-acetyltransferase
LEDRAVGLVHFTPKDISFGKTLTDEANWCRTRAAWKAILMAEPGGMFKATLNGVGVGIGGVVTYGRKVAWIHSVIVKKDFRNLGIGSKLTLRCIQHAEERGIPTVKLDATPHGLGLYRRLGFVEEFESTRFTGKGADPNFKTVGTRIRPGDLDDVCAFDRRMTGLNRKKVLLAVFKNNPKFGFVTRGSGRISGFILADRAEGRVEIGPCVAGPDEEDAVRDLFTAILGVSPRQPYRLCIPGKFSRALSLALELGFERKFPSSIRMYRGARFEEAEAEWAMISPAKG